MARDSGAELDQRWSEHIKRCGLGFERLDLEVERMAKEGRTRLKRVSYRHDGAQWMVTVTAVVDGKDVVQFATVDSVAGSPGKILNMLQQPVWKADKFATPAPHPVAQQLKLDLDTEQKKS